MKYSPAFAQAMKPLWVALVVWLLTMQGHAAPAFRMDACVGEASVIVRGTIDETGEMTVEEVLKGELCDARVVQIKAGRRYYQQRRKLEGRAGPKETIAFLGDKNNDAWFTAMEDAGLVGLNGDAVMVELDKAPHGLPPKEAVYTRASFLQALAEASQISDEREALLARPRSGERTQALIAFAWRVGHPANGNPSTRRFKEDYQLERVAHGLQHPAVEEQAALAQALRRTSVPSKLTMLLNLAEFIPLKDDTMDLVAGFATLNNTEPVREAAMNALNAINSSRAVDYLTDYLTLDDPLVCTALTMITQQPFTLKAAVLNVKVVDAIKQLAELAGVDQLTVKRAGGGITISPGIISSSFLRYTHPRLISTVYHWAIRRDSLNSSGAYMTLVQVTGLKYAQTDTAHWEQWWRGAQPLLEQEFKLDDAAGINQWMNCYFQSDAATQNILMRLWSFEAKINEEALLAAAMQNDSAKQVLAHLWEGKRLSPETRLAILQRFVSFKLVNHPPESAEIDTRLYGVALKGFVAFPFPNNIGFQSREAVAIDPEKPVLPDEAENTTVWTFSGHSDDYVEGTPAPSYEVKSMSPPEARGVIEWEERGDRTTGYEGVTQLWNLGPVRLRNPALEP